MAWKNPFIIYRITEDAKLVEVFQAEDIKKAKYWLTYIAKPGDVLCKTPIHPKHSGSTKCPEYWSHKESGGKLCHDKQAWDQLASDKHAPAEFPPETADGQPTTTS